ncbi:hypothetical protein [Anaeromyxobacter oryzae]|uniref:STAS domain-containing protein n=1 Tax=Anaeromyxobacter oryzae TaxID=2918170 RepID=A0ABM7X082_9BACT|nr:hypothetical protein [Anaeromyxobacter oryzae]BDG05116.1 hypothetical protein AMOR_41120 [Anaeromyxobacter oryzae]
MAAEVQPRARTVSVEGVFDLAVAAIIRTKLVHAGCDSVVIDFHGARDVSDVALAHLALTITKLQSPHVVLRGLGQHQERMLRYLHLDDRAPDAAASFT